MADVPRAVPPYGENVTSAWFYCLHCKHMQATDYAMQQHVRYSHYGDANAAVIYGEDYTNGTHLRVMQQRWDEWCLVAVDKFALQLDSLRGADDFELEVGDGVPE